MRVSVLAIIGGVFGVIFGFIGIIVGTVDEALSGDASIIYLGISAIAAAIFGIVCGALNFSSRYKKTSAFGLIVASIWHIISISLFGIPGLILLFLAGILGFFGKAGSGSGQMETNGSDHLSS